MDKKTKKYYCYVDESGQDVGSDVFITAAVISAGDQHAFRSELEMIEQQTKIFKRKWYRAGYEQRLDFINRILESGHKFGNSFYITYKKPILFFFPWLEIVSSSIATVATEKYKVQVYVDGIDRKKAEEMTNTLRAKGIKLSFVRSARDETEAFIRLADRVVGLVRAAKEQKGEYLKLLNEAKKLGIITEIKTTP